MRRLLVQGLTTPAAVDGIPLTATGASIDHMYTHTTPLERCDPPDPFFTHHAHTTHPGALWYDPTKQLRPGPPPKYPFKPEPRPLPKPGPTKGERYNLAEVLQLSSTW